MAIKTDREKTPEAPTQLAQRMPESMQFTELAIEHTRLPESLESMIEPGDTVQRHAKLFPGTFLQGIYRGMVDGELASRVDNRTGELVTPAVKWVFIETQPGVILRLLGGYNLVAQLEPATIGQRVIIARGNDYRLPNGFNCTEYAVIRKPYKGEGASAQVVEVSPSKTA